MSAPIPPTSRFTAGAERPSAAQAGRKGSALLIALALLVLSAALIAGSSASGRAASRSALSHEATVVAVAESRAAIAEFVSTWSAAQDGVPVGGELLGTIGPNPGGIGSLSVTIHTRLNRLTSTRYVLAIDCQVGAPGVVLASRRYYRLLERSAPDSTGASKPPLPIAQWSLADLY